MDFDPHRWKWRNGDLLLRYTAKLGRSLLNPRKKLNTPIHEKWPGALQASFKPAWTKVWDKNRARKEAAFMWSVWHNAVAVNAWRRRIFNGVSDLCPCCELSAEETPMHHFHSCPRTPQLWDYAQSIIHRLVGEPLGPHPRFTWRQCLFGSPLPRRYRSALHVWHLLRGAVLWIAWISRNAKVFRNETWPVSKLHFDLWESLIDTGKAAWMKVHAVRKCELGIGCSKRFDKNWCFSAHLAKREGGQVEWNYSLPPLGIFVPD